MIDILLEMKSLRMSVDSLEDYLLIDEVSLINTDEFIDKIIYSFIKFGILTDDEREQLINYYILYNCEEYFDE